MKRKMRLGDLKRLLRESIYNDQKQEDSHCPKCGAERYESPVFLGWAPCPRCNYEFKDTTDWDKKTLPENFLHESPDAKEETGDSVDVQIDRYFAQYEDLANDNSSTKNESAVDFRSMTRKFLSEAGQDDDDNDSEENADEKPSKLTLENIDIEAFVNSVVRLIDNYDSLLEIKNTVVRRAKNFLSKSYDEDTVSTFERVLREDHGVVAGQSGSETAAEEFQPPPGDHAGPDIATGAP